MSPGPLSPGSKAWIGLAVYVVVADGYLMVNQKKTMSAVFGDALNHPLRRWPVLVVWGFLSMHLHREVLPGVATKIDPLRNGARLADQVWYTLTCGHQEISN